MYNALNEDYMFQVSHDRTAELDHQHRKAVSHPDRRWWRKVASVAR